MRTATVAILLAATMAMAAAGCSKSDRCCDRYNADYCYRVLWDGDCHHGRYFVRNREFFDPDDFGRGHDSLYGDPRNRHDGDYSGYGDRDCCGHRHGRHARGRHHRHGSSEDAVSERYAPPPAPDTEYDE